MRFISPFIAATASALAVANTVHRADVYDMGGRQEQMPIGDVPPLTRTRMVTETQTFFEVVETVYMTKPQLVPTWVPIAAQAEEPVPAVEDACDEDKEIGCAVCRVIHDCADFAFDEEWYV